MSQPTMMIGTSDPLYYRPDTLPLSIVRAINRPQARENASDQVAIGFSFASDWLRGWCEFSRPITERSKAKPMQSRITFDTQLKIALL